MAKDSAGPSREGSEQVPVRHGPGWSWKWYWIVTAISIALFVAMFISFEQEDASAGMGAANYGAAIGGGVAGGLFGGFVYYGFGFIIVRSIYFAFFERRATTQAVAKKTEELQDAISEDFFNNLVRINFKYIDKYYLQTQEQADKSFFLCLFSGLVGLAVVACGIVMMFLGKTSPAYVTTAAGVLAQFISAVFFYLYNNTIVSMGDYHRKLVVTQNISLALKITDGLPAAQRGDAQMSLVEALTLDVNHLLAAPNTHLGGDGGKRAKAKVKQPLQQAGAVG